MMLVALALATTDFCPTYHPIRDGGVYDPSGPLLDQQGVWHLWEDEGAWSNWTSVDLVHWEGSLKSGTSFGGDTGSVSPTPSGTYAFWPIMSGPGKGAIGSAKAVDEKLTQWDHRGATIPQPTRAKFGYRDPTRAFLYHDKWFVGVGCGTPEGAEFCLFEASDDTLSNFTDQGSLYTTNRTFGNVDGNIVWQPENVSANMMECPDFFPLGDKWVLIGSLYKTNQWWVGTVAGDPPRFTPERVGILDYGNGYAAKTGSTVEQSGQARRLAFGFTGWQEPTAPSGCGRSLILPRDLSVQGSELRIVPIPEVEKLRAGAALVPPQFAQGSQVEVRAKCTGGKSGKVAVRTLQTADGRYYTEVGYDFARQRFYADHSRCCAQNNSIVQSAALVVDTVELAVFVDGGLIEAFCSGKAITPLVNPDAAAGAPDARTTTFINTAGASCDIQSWRLDYGSKAVLV